MQLTRHAIKRIVERNKLASFMTPKELNDLVVSSEIVECSEVVYYLMKTIDLVLVVNKLNGNALTAYCLSTSKFSKRKE